MARGHQVVGARGERDLPEQASFQHALFLPQLADNYTVDGQFDRLRVTIDLDVRNRISTID